MTTSVQLVRQNGASYKQYVVRRAPVDGEPEVFTLRESARWLDKRNAANTEQRQIVANVLRSKRAQFRNQTGD